MASRVSLVLQVSQREPPRLVVKAVVAAGQPLVRLPLALALVLPPVLVLPLALPLVLVLPLALPPVLPGVLSRRP